MVFFPPTKISGSFGWKMVSEGDENSIVKTMEKPLEIVVIIIWLGLNVNSCMQSWLGWNAVCHCRGQNLGWSISLQQLRNPKILFIIRLGSSADLKPSLTAAYTTSPGLTGLFAIVEYHFQISKEKGGNVQFKDKVFNFTRFCFWQVASWTLILWAVAAATSILKGWFGSLLAIFRLTEVLGHSAKSHFEDNGMESYHAASKVSQDEMLDAKNLCPTFAQWEKWFKF